MKCRNCDKEAIYEDGLCEECHRRAAGQDGDDPRVQVLSREERNNFHGQTIDEDGTVYGEGEDREEKRQSHSGVHVYTSVGSLPFRIELAAGFIIFVIIAIILAALSLLIMVGPYLIAAFVILLVYNAVKAFMGR